MKKIFYIIGFSLGILLILAIILPVITAEHGVDVSQLQISQLKLALEQYKDDFGHYPQGNSSEISRKLLGDNPTNIVYLDGKIVDEGFILDHWGRPYRFRYYDGAPIISSFGENYKDFKDDKTNR